MQAIRVNFAALAATRRPVILVVRVQGAALPANAVAPMLALIHDWQSALPVAGIEVDFDSGTRRLGDYSDFLRVLHAAIGPQLPLAITLLPDWLDMPEFPRLLASVDQVVLQLHSLPALGTALFDPAQALLWTQRMARYAKPFRLALPNYGSRVSLDARGKIVAVESEVPVDLPKGEIQEIFAAPQAVAGFLAALERKLPSTFLGVVWFRLPVDSDARVWSRNTWHSVIRRQVLEPQLRAQWNPGPHRGTGGQLLLINDGAIDAEFPENLVINRNCGRGSEQPYLLEPAAPSSGSSVFARSRKGLLRAGSAMVAATAFCTGETQAATIRINR